VQIFKPIISIILAVLTTLLALVLLSTSPLNITKNVVSDFIVTSYKSQVSASSDIVLVIIGEKTLQRLPYRSPIDRKFLTGLLKSLLSADVKSIGLDILLDQPTEADKDEQLKVILAKHSEKIIVATATQQDGLSEQQVEFQERYLKNINKANVLLGQDNNDGVVRHAVPNRFMDNQIVPSLANAMAPKGLKDSESSFRRIFYGTKENRQPIAFKSYPAEAVFLLPKEWFKDKYVLIGSNLSGIDQFRTPYISRFSEQAGTLAGVEIHAHILHQILTSNYIAEFSNITRILAMYFASLLALLLVFLNLRFWNRLLLVCVCLGLLFTAAFVIFDLTLLLIPVFSLGVSFLLSALLGLGLVWHKDYKQKRFIKNAWAHYVSSKVVDDLISNPSNLRLGGEGADASYIFTDVAGFTTLSEKLSPGELSEVLNEYLDMLSDTFLSFDATVDKIVGDAMVGFIGAPIPDAKHPDKAVALALKLNEISTQFSEEKRKAGIEFGKTRIGVNSGTAIIGNFGGSNFFDYSAIGDAVNIAARLEAANKVIGTSICISGDTARRAINHTCRPIGHLCLSGKETTIEAWEPMSNDQNLATLEEYMKAYHLTEVSSKSAHASWVDLSQKYPADPLVEFHKNRSRSNHKGLVIDALK